jgi:hypothetical protein
LSYIIAMSPPGSIPTSLQFSQPPSTKDTKADPAPTLAWLKNKIAIIYQEARTSPVQDRPPTLARTAYLNLYSAAHDYCELTKTARTSPNCNDLYQFVQSEIRAHCSEIRACSHPSENGTGVDDARSTVEMYLAQGHQFALLAGLISNLLRVLDRARTKRNIDEGKKHAYLIKDLHNLLWKSEILRVGVDSAETEKIASAVATLRQQTESQIEGDKVLVDKFMESLETIGVRPVAKADDESST